MASPLLQLPFNNADTLNNGVVPDFMDVSVLNDNDLNDIDDRFDHTLFSEIDPDIHVSKTNNCLYYNEKTFNNKCHGINNPLSFIHVNICSIPKNYGKFDAFLATLEHKFPIICCSESWFKNTSIDRHTPSGFTHVYDYRPKKRGGGTSMFIKNTIQYQQRDDLKLDIEVNLSNSCFIEIDKHCVSGTRNIIVGCIYKAPHCSIAQFNEKFNDVLNCLSNEKKDIFILGDFNIDGADRCSSNRQTQEFLNIIAVHSFTNLIQKPTRITNHSATLIDGIITNVSIENNIHASGIFPTKLFSDHFPIFTILKNSNIRNRNKFVTKRFFSQKNISLFNKSLKSNTWEQVYTTKNTNNAFSQFQEIVNTYISIHFPEKTEKISYAKRLPWLTHTLRVSIEEKNKLSVKSMLAPTDVHLRTTYKNMKNELTSVLRNAELKYFSDQLELNKSDLSKSWKIIKDISGLNNTNSSNISLVINGNMTNDELLISNEFNNFFVTIGSQLASSINSTIDPISYVKGTINSIVIPNITENMIKKTIDCLKNSAPGWDNLPPSVGKQCIDAYVEPLTYIINLSLAEGIFPDNLKLARVVPIYKSGDKKSVNNYRPISILTFFSKIFEKVLYTCVTNFMDAHEIISKQQFGFRKGHSTQQAVISLVNNITHSLDSGNIIVGVFIDLKKAFDTVDHKILLKKLYNYGIRGNVHRWFSSYLSGRTQYVTINNNKSKTLEIQCGVPQGSILGPLLFIIYVNDICNVSELLYNILYADDTSVLLEGKHLDVLVNTMNKELDLLHVWLKANKLSLNTQKTYFMVFHRARHKININNIMIENVLLKQVRSLKYLGLVIDDKLKWIDHIAHVKNKISRGIGIIGKAKPFLNKKCLCNLYYSFIYPYLIYCVEVWGNAIDTHLLPLCALQNKIVRIINCSHYKAPTNPIYYELSILPLKKVVTQRIALMMYKYSHGMLPRAMNELYTFNNEIHTYNTRQRNLLHIPDGTHTRNFQYRSILIWNELVNRGIDTKVSLVVYKKNIKLFLLHNDINIGYTV